MATWLIGDVPDDDNGAVKAGGAHDSDIRGHRGKRGEKVAAYEGYGIETVQYDLNKEGYKRPRAVIGSIRCHEDEDERERNTLHRRINPSRPRTSAGMDPLSYMSRNFDC
jgi:hypothetical protein